MQHGEGEKMTGHQRTAGGRGGAGWGGVPPSSGVSGAPQPGIACTPAAARLAMSTSPPAVLHLMWHLSHIQPPGMHPATCCLLVE